MADKIEPNVTRENGRLKIARAFVSSEPTAKLTKKKIHIQLEINLDESSIAARDVFAYWHFDETPLQVTIKPERGQLGLPLGDDDTTVTLSVGGEAVTVTSEQFARAAREMSGGDDETA